LTRCGAHKALVHDPDLLLFAVVDGLIPRSVAAPLGFALIGEWPDCICLP